MAKPFRVNLLLFCLVDPEMHNMPFFFFGGGGGKVWNCNYILILCMSNKVNGKKCKCTPWYVGRVIYNITLFSGKKLHVFLCN